MSGEYQVLSPWAEADPRPLAGISSRVGNLAGKNIGLFANYKRAAPLIQKEVQRQLAAKFPTARFTEFQFGRNFDVSETQEIKKLENWLQGVDTIVAAIGD
jgi:hypothetical protein